MGANNPAGRLLAVLDAAKKIDGEAKHSRTAYDVLRLILCAADESPPAVFQRVGHFLAMPELICSSVEASPCLARV